MSPLAWVSMASLPTQTLRAVKCAHICLRTGSKRMRSRCRSKMLRSTWFAASLARCFSRTGPPATPKLVACRVESRIVGTQRGHSLLPGNAAAHRNRGARCQLSSARHRPSDADDRQPPGRRLRHRKNSGPCDRGGGLTQSRRAGGQSRCGGCSLRRHGSESQNAKNLRRARLRLVRRTIRATPKGQANMKANTAAVVRMSPRSPPKCPACFRISKFAMAATLLSAARDE